MRNICYSMKFRALTATLVFLFLAVQVNVSPAQVLRLGPFDVDMETGFQAIYTTNVEDERPSESTESREDYYFIGSLDLSTHASMAPETDISLETGLAYEKHLKRPDLDNSNDPFGKFILGTSTKWRRSTFSLDVDIQRLSESKDDIYIAGGGKGRALNDDFNYGLGWAWDWKRFKAGASVSYEHIRYDDEQYQDGDKDETNIDFEFSWELTKRISLEYTYNRSLEDWAYNPVEDNDLWEVTSTADVRYQVMKVPDWSVFVGYTKDSEESGTHDWYPTYGTDASAVLLDTKRVKFDVNLSWTHVKEIPNDSSFIYGANLEHQISRTAKQSLSATQEPIETFGSDNDTEETTIAYRFDKEDLFVYNMDLTAGVAWKKDKPQSNDDEPAGDTEETWTYDVELTHQRALTRKLKREVSCYYSYEESNLEEEPLDEFRLTLDFTYAF